MADFESAFLPMNAAVTVQTIDIDTIATVPGQVDLLWSQHSSVLRMSVAVMSKYLTLLYKKIFPCLKKCFEMSKNICWVILTTATT